MPAYPWIAFMGWMIVLIALLIGIFALAPAQQAFFADSKAVREAAGAGSTFVNANVKAHVIEAWVPQFKFLGLGMGLMAIVMALGTIAIQLRKMGAMITGHMKAEYRPMMPSVPRAVRVFQLSTLMGVMVLAAALVIGLLLISPVANYWTHSIASELNTAIEGSALLNKLGLVGTFAFWLNPLRMMGMAFLFTSISIALTVIIATLRKQAGMLVNFYQQATQ